MYDKKTKNKNSFYKQGIESGCEMDTVVYVLEKKIFN